MSEPLLKLSFLAAFFFLFLLFPKNVLAAIEITLLSYPPEVQIGEEFAVSFKATGLNSGSDYYTKGRLGKEESSLSKGQTFNSDTSSWLSDNSPWVDFPKMTANQEGTISGQLKLRASSSAETGENILKVRIRKVDTQTNHDSSPGLITLLVAPTPTPTQTPTPAPASASSPTNTPTPASTPTKKPTPTKKLTKTPTPTPTLKPSGEILGEESIPSPTATPASEATEQKFDFSSLLPKILIGTGFLFLAVSGGFLLLPKIKGYNRKSEKTESTD